MKSIRLRIVMMPCIQLSASVILLVFGLFIHQTCLWLTAFMQIYIYVLCTKRKLCKIVSYDSELASTDRSQYDHKLLHCYKHWDRRENELNCMLAQAMCKIERRQRRARV